MPDADPDEQPVRPEDVAADEQLVDDLAAGAPAPGEDQAADGLAAWRDHARSGDDLAVGTDDLARIYRRLFEETPIDLPPSDPGRDPATTMLPAVTASYPDPGPVLSNSNPPAETAGEQDHTNPWLYAGPDADPPGAP